MELTQAYTSSSTCVTLTVADVDIRFADVVTDEEDDDVSKPDVDVSDGERHTHAARRIRLRQLHRNRN